MVSTVFIPIQNLGCGAVDLECSVTLQPVTVVEDPECVTEQVKVPEVSNPHEPADPIRLSCLKVCT